MTEVAARWWCRRFHRKVMRPIGVVRNNSVCRLCNLPFEAIFVMQTAQY